MNFYCQNCPPEHQVPRSLDDQVAHVFTEHRNEKPETFRVVLPLPRLEDMRRGLGAKERKP